MGGWGACSHAMCLVSPVFSLSTQVLPAPSHPSLACDLPPTLGRLFQATSLNELDLLSNSAQRARYWLAAAFLTAEVGWRNLMPLMQVTPSNILLGPDVRGQAPRNSAAHGTAGRYPQSRLRAAHGPIPPISGQGWLNASYFDRACSSP